MEGEHINTTQHSNEPMVEKKNISTFAPLSARAKTALMMIGTSLATTVVVVGGLAVVVWYNGARIVSHFLPKQPAAQVLSSTQTSSPSTIATAPTPVASDLSVADVVAKANKSVVSIEVYQQAPVYAQGQAANPFGDLFPGFFVTPQQQIGTEEQKVGGGSGFFVTSDGMIVTNRHVVDFPNATFKAITIDGKKYTATVVAKDPVLDVAILKVNARGFTPVTLGNSDSLVLGQSVVAIGYALGEFKNSVSTGIVSGLSRSIVAGDNSGNAEQLDKVIQTDAAINPGNSGGPLLNLRGEVIGVDVAMAEGSQNIAFALPINSVKQVIDSVKKNGTIVRPYVGIRYVPVTPELQKENNLPVDYGILVQRGQNDGELAVIPGSPADRAGIVENDIILSVDGVKLDQDSSFVNIIRSKNIGQSISLQVLSKGIQKTVSLTLVPAP